MGFKTWFLNTENLAGPGDGPDAAPMDQVRYHGNLAQKGVGAFPTFGDNPPKPAKSPTARYLPKMRKK